ncbi:BREX-1 system adenine-specific DNA-methyltransferase PglX [Thermoanaerobacterium thermosaccharolyticum]|uniref:BREX-1 system adenine-specific DNA-methyltransferase PglX n=1 Tax=Thermoanaerobacterium thermosaccharolyticum TaxID=1517 RepID=UPI0017865AE5|nr:BREX-1 system adenine-specific DNA-methyltransferase PglX [Thermoanaerobacterium thermosaccharolyticum]MBE0069727.1 BREX-1 system adenine-specific DNA-methyltransferase PglX [Thermoanaerobacterium thermosaccharolyticum]MBE0229453.1 BREX-1 system adenine-specific DNA-methyltransferase PglX [Thermoanaerobacterium thermosaccharolyticum]
MNKNAIKNYAVWARNQLINDIEFKAYSYEITKDSIEDVKKLNDAVLLNGKLYSDDVYDKRNKLIERIREVGDFDQVIEEIAYTWFNRFIALRYMEVNGYLPTGVRVLSSSEEGRWEPDIVYNALTVDLPVDKKKVLEYKEKNNIEELYRYLLIIQCNELNRILPFMFEEINDYTELLLPDNLLKEGSVIRRLVSDIDEADFKEGVEIIGWLYQFYVSEKKDEVYRDLKNKIKISKETISVATQLYTPKWIVKYLVENSVGRLWIESHPNSDLMSKWEYYVDTKEQDSKTSSTLNAIIDENLKPEDIKILDPACGSGHMLVYAFELLYDIYLSYGYMKSEIPALIIENNLYGLDIDDRAVQLASFAVVMKAREKNRLFFRYIEKNKLNINITSFQETNIFTETGDAKKILLQGVKDKEHAERQIDKLFSIFKDAKFYGSIIETNDIDLDFWRERLDFIYNQIGNMIDYDYSVLMKLKKFLPRIVKQTEILSRKYHVVVTNPPYMGLSNIDEKLSNFIKLKYPNSKQDLFAVFIERAFKFVDNYFVAMVTMQSWMFLSSFTKFREDLIDSNTIYTMTHMGNMVMGIAFGTSATIWRNNYIPGYKGIYNYVELKDINEFGYPYEFPVKNNRYRSVDQSTFKSIPGSPIAYWVSDNMREAFVKGTKLGDIAEPKQGLSTSDNDRFLRLWHEVDINKIGFGFKSRDEAKESRLKWFPYNKGGSYRKWYGNNEYVVNWYDDGEELKNWVEYLNKTATPAGRLKNKNYYFREGITWSFVSSSRFGVRYSQNGFIFDVGGSSIFPPVEGINSILAFLCSKLSYEFLKALNPTMNFQVGNIASLPFIDVGPYKTQIDKLVNQNISISKTDWDSFETSWDFEEHPFLKYRNGADTIEEAYNNWADFAENQFNTLKANEEELNRIFIDIYGLQDELTPDVDDNDVTVRKADPVRDVKSFISYAVGCMFGRYSLDKKGLVYAGGEFDIDEYKTYKADEDGIIPITDSEYFQDDIVSKFIDFVRTVFGSNTLSQNLEFIANAIGRNDNETAADAIRRYFLNGFYKDHTSIYQKRPIYWLFTSGKEKAFNALIYIHRYDKDTLAKMRTDYLHMLINKVSSEVNRLNSLMASYIPKDEKRRYEKLLDKLNKQLQEMGKYDELLRHYAERGIEIDLDDGVKINYTKFDGLLANIR